MAQKQYLTTPQYQPRIMEITGAETDTEKVLGRPRTLYRDAVPVVRAAETPVG